MEMLGKIRRMYMRDKMSVRAIAKRTGLSRNSLQKWLATPEEVALPKYVRVKGFSKLGVFADALEQAHKADHRMQVSHIKLRASRVLWLVAYPSQGREMLFDAHTRSFAAVSGVGLFQYDERIGFLVIDINAVEVIELLADSRVIVCLHVNRTFVGVNALYPLRHRPCSRPCSPNQGTPWSKSVSWRGCSMTVRRAGRRD